MEELQFWRPWQPRSRLRVPGAEIAEGFRRAAKGRSGREGGGGRCAACRLRDGRGAPGGETTTGAGFSAAAAVASSASQFCKESLGIHLDGWQARFIDGREKRKLLLGARQCGKSMAVAAMAVHRMLTKADQQVVVIAASERQSGLFVEKCKWMLRKLGFAVHGDVRLWNGSRVVGLPCVAETIRGFTADLLVMDEAAWIPDVVYAAARPMLAATGGDLVVMSSANEPEGFFWALATSTCAVGWLREKVRAGQVTRFSAEFLAEERKALGAEAYGREYECVFRDVGRGVFHRGLVESALSDEVTPLFGGTKK